MTPRFKVITQAGPGWDASSIYDTERNEWLECRGSRDELTSLCVQLNERDDVDEVWVEPDPEFRVP